MTMLTKTEIVIISAGLVVAFAFGRYSAEQISTKTASTQVTDTKQNQTISDKKKVTTTETKKPDGTSQTVTQVDEDVETTIATKTDETSKSTVSSVPAARSKTNISILGANDFSRGLLIPTYGISVNREVLGPVTVGAFGLMNGTIGVSVGVNF